MALIKFGMMMTDARGKLGGQVFTRNRSGATVRTKVTPSNPQTLAQQTARSIFGQLSQAWRGLTEAERASWNAAVSNFQKTNIFGDNYLSSGKNLFVSLNGNLVNGGGTQIKDAPNPVTVPELLLNGGRMDITTEELTLDFSSVEPGIGYIKIIEATRPFSAGRYNFSGAYSKVVSWNGTTMPDGPHLFDEYVNKFGLPAAGTKISFRASVVVEETGQSSVPSSYDTIVVASVGP